MPIRSSPGPSPLGIPRVLRVLVFLAVLLLFLVIASRLESRTWYIKADGTGDAPTIQAGMDSASAADTVMVGAGTFDDTTHVAFGSEIRAVCVWMYKNVVLMGSGATVTTVGSAEADIVVFADQVGAGSRIEGFKLTTISGGYACVDADRAPPSAGTRGIFCEASSVVVTGNEIEANAIAVHMFGSSALLSDNEIHGCVSGMVLEKSSDAVIQYNHVYDCAGFLSCEGSSPQILNNVMHDACDGLFFGAGCSPYISGNRIEGIRPEFTSAITSLSGAVIEGNTLSSVYNGVAIGNEWPETRVVRGNTITYAVNGVEISRPNTLVENNTIDVVTAGIWGAAGQSYIIRNNIITRATWGIWGDVTDPPTVECNDVFGSTGSAYVGIPDQTGQNGNIALDPEFCGIDDSGNYYLQSDSPCAPGNHPSGLDCGLIGALPVNCGNVPAKPVTWGSVKSKFGPLDRR